MKVESHIFDMRRHAGEDLVLWNPSTKESKKLSEPVVTDSFWRYGKSQNNGLGLGYKSIIDDFKIIRIDVFYDYPICHGCKVNVYTLRSNSWKELPNIIPYDVCLPRPYRTKPALVNGYLHWVGTPVDGQGTRTDSKVILSFNLENDVCSEVPVTQQLRKSLFQNRKADSTAGSPSDEFLVGSLDGCLCILSGYNIPNTYFRSIKNIELWVMKEYGVMQSWTKLSTFTRDSIQRSTIMLSQMESIDFVDDKVLFMGGAGDRVYISILIYDPKHGTSRRVRIQYNSLHCPKIETYFESLTSLN
ncbi:F-box protein CPR1-like [Papaver somniferum]|uniref:F-box protein CPR1-like n=1 Tax=Papaver somniferum TaxID=3469 RepID=UPI000E704E30|nr:F-box protein CPR1-like [Papaver somniferum]